MPIKRRIRKRRPNKKRVYRKRMYKRVVRPKNLFLYQRHTDLLGLNNTAASAGLTTSSIATGILTFTLGAATASAYYFASSMAFKFDDLPGITDFTTLYDRYKLNMIKFKVYPFANDPSTANTTASSGGVGLLIHSIIDHDDNNVMTANDAGIDTMRQYASYRVHNMAQSKVFKRIVKPNLLSQINTTAGVYSGNSVIKSRYIDMSQTSVPHYGMKIMYEFVSPTAATTTYNLKFEVKYYFSCKDSR